MVVIVMLVFPACQYDAKFICCSSVGLDCRRYKLYGTYIRIKHFNPYMQILRMDCFVKYNTLANYKTNL